MPSLHRTRDASKQSNSSGNSRLSYRQRIEILTLHNYAGWSHTHISSTLSIPRSTVRRTIAIPETPKKPQGRPPILNTPIRKRLIQRATIDGYHRKLAYLEIAALEEISACKRTLQKAFEKERYFRRVATEKPLLTEKHMRDRLEWAYCHKDWNSWQWSRVIWTDECSIKCGYHGQVYVTRQPEEKYLPACCIPKFRGYSACMVWGCITSSFKGPLIIFNEGSINGDIYREHVVPLIHQFKKDVPIPILMEDGASIHRARATQELHQEHQILQMAWPANSPDLNPIENVWRLLKYRVGRYFPKTKEEVRYYVQQEWEKLTVQDFTHYVSNMRERCLAVIEAGGGHTKW
jgi:transposase